MSVVRPEDVEAAREFLHGVNNKVEHASALRQLRPEVREALFKPSAQAKQGKRQRKSQSVADEQQNSRIGIRIPIQPSRLPVAAAM